MSARVFALMLFSVASYAQVTGRLTGSVVDASGAAVPGASVQVLLRGGNTPVLTAKTTAEGLFNLIGVRPEFYDVSVAAQGFVTATVHGVKVDPARETVVPPINLELATVTTSVDVQATSQSIQTANAEVSTTVTNEQVQKLPVLDRYALGLIYTQAGVAVGRTYTAINGLRTTYGNVTLDGINVQDNLFRENGLDFTPNLLQVDQVKEMTISTSNTNATASGGAAQVSIMSPSGTNEYHGSAVWYNRNNALAAADWFDNKDGNGKAFLNQNILGGRIGGPVFKDKLLFYVNYEGVRLRQKATQDRTILTQDARNGFFTYQVGQAVRRVNILQAAGVEIDPVVQGILKQVPGPEKINNFRTGDSSASLLRNTAGYSFQGRDNDTRDNVTAKLDYVRSTKNLFSGSYVWNRRIVDRSDISNDYSLAPKVFNDDRVRLISLAWRWNPRPAITNELRGGANLAPASFNTTEKFGAYILDAFVWDNPLNTFRAQGRKTHTYSLQDNASYVRGRHNLQFGFHMQQVRTAPYDDANTIPTYFIGIGTGNPGLAARSLPGASATDRGAADALLASLAGYVEAYQQQFNITSRTSGFVSGASDVRHFRYNNYAGYVQDSWKALPRLAVTLGLRYDYYGVVDERDGLELLPVLQNNNPIATLLSNATLDFAGSGTGRPFYKPDRNNFAPNVGVAWDLFGRGKTALRAGYSINYVDDNTIATVWNSAYTNSGLEAFATDVGLEASVADLPPVPVPVYKVPRTFSDNYELNSSNAQAMPDPNLRTPYVQQWTFGIQHEMKGTIIEGRYVGNHATKSLRAFDYNQVVIRENGFLADFLKAQSNGNLAQASRGIFDPRYNPNIPGSQRLLVFDRLRGGGSLDNSTIGNLIQQGQVGQLALVYQTNHLNGPIDFFRNPYSLGTNMISNYTNSTYNALQVDVRRQASENFYFQANYTFSKVLSDALGDTQVRFEPFLDLANAKIERARSPFDIRHVIKANGAYTLPLGDGRRWNYRPLRRLLGGWSLSGLMTWQSGTPFSILSARATVNRGTRSLTNTATTLLTKPQLDKVVGFRMTGNGPYFVDPSILGPDGRAVAADGSAPFNGQVLFNPGAGTLGALQRRMFDGPWFFDLDMGVQKLTHITERQSIELRFEAANVFNHPAFFVGDDSGGNASFNINSTKFGQIVSMFNSRRVVQVGLKYRF